MLVSDDFTIFSLVAPSVTILSLLFLYVKVNRGWCITATDHHYRLQFAQPVIEVVAHALVGILWLSEFSPRVEIFYSHRCHEAMAAWAS